MRLAADTIAALSTPTGVSALAVLRTSGPASARLAREVCGETPPPRHAHHADYRGITGELIDDVVLTFFAGPNSYTGEDVLEITCHGNPLITQLILGDLLARGCRLAEPGEFTRRAFLNGRIDLNQAEGVMEVIHARSERALALAQRQLRGGFGESLQVIERELRDASARIEAYIDFPEEDLPPEDRGVVLAVVDGALRAVDRLLATSRRTALVRDGVKVVIVGEPNAGKSSLLNRLLGRERALVSAEPGTTRDFIEESMLLDGHRLRLIDTAGLNPSAGALERLGIGKTLEHSSVADLFLWITDVTAPVRELPPVLRQRMSPVNTVAVLNKTDLLPHSTATASGEGTCSIGGFAAIPLSVLTGDGWDALLGALRERLRGLTTGIDDGDGSDIAVSMRQEQVLAAVRENLAAAREKLAAESAPTELIATDLRAALDAGAQAGRSDNEQVLDRLFASFCIGK